MADFHEGVVLAIAELEHLKVRLWQPFQGCVEGAACS